MKDKRKYFKNKVSRVVGYIDNNNHFCAIAFKTTYHSENFIPATEVEINEYIKKEKRYKKVSLIKSLNHN